MSTLDVRRGDSRLELSEPGVRSLHSFSFGPHFDPTNTRFGALVCHHEALLEPHGGFAAHPHANLEIVSWVLAGEIAHQDDHSPTTLEPLRPGTAQLLSAGSGVQHSEIAVGGPARLLQMWAPPDRPGRRPRLTRSEPLGDAPWVPLAGVDGVLPLDCEGVSLWRGRLEGQLHLPEADLLHVFVAQGQGLLEDGIQLQAGDAVRATDAGGIAISGHAELIVWAMPQPWIAPR